MDSEKKITALVVEDNPTQANMLRISLTRRGFDVEAVAYLGHALERLARGGIDVVLLDLSLPDSDGIQTFYAVYNQAPEVPIVVLSGLNDHAVAQAALEGGAQDYLVKGVPSDESISRCLRYAIERHRFERKIWESERITRLIVENAHDAFISMDAVGNISGWNLKAESIFGWYQKDALGKPLLEIIFPEELRAFVAQQIGAFLQGERGNLINHRVETVLLRKDGSKFPAELAMFPVTIGSIYTLCGFVQDISDRKMVEQRMQQINSELEVLVHERTSQLDDSSTHLHHFANETARRLQEPLLTMQALAASLAGNLRELDGSSNTNNSNNSDISISSCDSNSKFSDQLSRLIACAQSMVATVQGMATEYVRVESAQSMPPTAGSVLPPIAQIRLPDQMVPTSNIVPGHLGNNPRATKTLPALERPAQSANVTKTLPAMERPAPQKQQS